jgi:hypothetical protein
VAELLQSGAPLPACPYGIDLRHKLRLAQLKLSGPERFPSGAPAF